MKTFPFVNNTFDLVFNPISNCYIETIQNTWNECARVIKKGGILMMAFVNKEYFIFELDFQKEDFLISRYDLPFNPYGDL